VYADLQSPSAAVMWWQSDFLQLLRYENADGSTVLANVVRYVATQVSCLGGTGFESGPEYNLTFIFECLCSCGQVPRLRFKNLLGSYYLEGIGMNGGNSIITVDLKEI